MIYHYTTLYTAELIFKTGYLKVSDWEIENEITPAALWCSKNTLWEPSASSAISNYARGVTITLTFQQQHESYGCTRFVLPFINEELCSWSQYQYETNISHQDYLEIENEAVQKGANTSDWYASFKDISLNDIIGFEIWDGVKWVSHIDDYKEAIELHFKRLKGIH